MAAEDINAARRADPTIPLSMGESRFIIRTGSACSGWMPGKRILADIPKVAMANARGIRIIEDIRIELLAVPGSFARKMRE